MQRKFHFDFSHQRSKMKKFIFCFKFNKVKLKKLKPSREHFIKFILYFLLVCALSFYISKISNKYFFNPDIGLSEKTIQAELIPFPALTICSPFMMKSKYTNYMKYQESFNKGITLNLSVSEQNYLAAKSQSCSLHKWKILENGTKDRNNFNFAKLLEESAPSVDDLFVYCSIKGVKKDCNSLLTRALNDHGMCYSFNMQSFKSIFNEVEISSDFHSFKNNEEKEEIQWSLDKGYNNDKSDVRPFRSLLGVNFGFYMAINDTDMHDLCDSLKRNFRLVYHMPNEMGTFWHENYYFRINSEHSVLMTAKKYTSDSRLRKYSVQKRQCYYEGERKLQFFKAYTKAHCNFECMTNFTLRQCGCMKFSFPRNESTKVCDLNMTKCHMDAYNNWPKFDEMSNTTSTPCNCFPPCSDIRYSMKNSIVDEINVNSNDVIQKVKVMRK